MRKARLIAEPCTIDADVIAEFLLQHGWESSAEFVRYLGAKAKEQNLESARWRDAYAAVLARLEQYEPRQPKPEPISCKPDWTCDG